MKIVRHSTSVEVGNLVAAHKSSMGYVLSNDASARFADQHLDGTDGCKELHVMHMGIHPSQARDHAREGNHMMTMNGQILNGQWKSHGTSRNRGKRGHDKMET